MCLHIYYVLLCVLFAICLYKVDKDVKKACEEYLSVFMCQCVGEAVAIGKVLQARWKKLYMYVHVFFSHVFLWLFSLNPVGIFISLSLPLWLVSFSLFHVFFFFLFILLSYNPFRFSTLFLCLSTYILSFTLVFHINPPFFFFFCHIISHFRFVFLHYPPFFIFTSPLYIGLS